MFLEIFLKEQDICAVLPLLDLAVIRHSVVSKNGALRVEGSEEDLRYFIRILETRKMNYTLNTLNGKKVLFSTG